MKTILPILWVFVQAMIRINLTLEDFEKIAKLVKNKLKNTKFDEQLKELAQTEYCDKKYLNKILKIY